MRVALALVAVVMLALGCRGRARKRLATAYLPEAHSDLTVGEWSCGEVHDAQPLRRNFGTRGHLVVGALADTRDARPETIAAVNGFAQRFAAAHVDAVAALGDLGRDEGAIERVLLALRDAKAPVLAIAGEHESENAFHAAVKQARNAGMDVIDLVEKRLIKGDDIDIVSLPGYPFTDRGCRYRTRDLEAVRALVKTKSHPLIVLGHMPPRGQGAAAVDASFNGEHVGDAAVTALLADVKPRVALFAHVDEAGGHVEANDKSLLMNVGGADAVMGARAAIVRLDGARATAEALP